MGLGGVLGLYAVPGLSLVAASRGDNLAAVLGPLIAVASLVGATHGLSRCSVACGIFPHRGSNVCPLHLTPNH